MEWILKRGCKKYSLFLLMVIMFLEIFRNPVECGGLGSIIFPGGRSAKKNFPTSSSPASSSDSAGDGFRTAERKRNFWELISSSTDAISVSNRSSSLSDGTLLTLGSSLGSGNLIVSSRLQKLQHHFNTLKVQDEDCRQRLLCNLAENPEKFAPFSHAMLDETSFIGDEKTLANALLATNEGARLLTYIEAAEKGKKRSGCDIWTYRCPQTATSMIDYKALLVWKEISKFLTVNFVAKKS